MYSGLSSEMEHGPIRHLCLMLSIPHLKILSLYLITMLPDLLPATMMIKQNPGIFISIVAEDPAHKITIATGTIHLEDGMSVNPSEILIQLSDT